jgi:hypothetical protein
MENDLVLQAAFGEAEMLIFPTCLLPEQYKSMCGASFFHFVNIIDCFSHPYGDETPRNLLGCNTLSDMLYQNLGMVLNEQQSYQNLCSPRFLFYFWISYICHSPLPSCPATSIVHHTSTPLLHSMLTLRYFLLLCTILRCLHSYLGVYD